MNQGFTPGQNRQQIETLEKGFKFPQGSLQAVFEQQTGWKDKPFLPQHEYSKFNGDRLDEFNRGAQRFQEKLDEFNGVLPLAADAFYRGDKATRRSLTEGFPEEATNRIHNTMSAMEKFGGEPYTPELQSELSGHVGAATASVEPYRNKPIPQMFDGTQLFKMQDGSYKTNDALLNMFLEFESKGRADAQAPNSSAAGLFQFIKSTGERYGLYKDGEYDHRLDPQKSFEAAMSLTKDGAKGLQQKGIPLTPGHFYLAHQQGLGGVSQIRNHLLKGSPISAEVMKNMRNNWNPKWGDFSVEKFYNRWNDKAQKAYARHAKENDSVFVNAEYALVGDVRADINDPSRNIPPDLQNTFRPENSVAEQEAAMATRLSTGETSRGGERGPSETAQTTTVRSPLNHVAQAPIQNVGPLRSAQLMNMNENISRNPGLAPKAIRDVIRGIIQKSG